MKKRFEVISIEIAVQIKDTKKDMSEHEGMYSVDTCENLNQISKTELRKKIKGLIAFLEIQAGDK